MTGERSDDRPPGPGTILVIGETSVAQRVCSTLTEDRQQLPVRHLVAPNDCELQMALADDIRAVAILVRDDVSALRYALAVAHMKTTAPLTVTIFDRTISEQLRRFLPQASVISSASLAAPSLVGPCLGGSVDASFTAGPDAIHASLVEGRVETVRNGHTQRRPLQRFVAAWAALGLRNHSAGSRLLAIGLAGLLAILLADWLWLALVERKHLSSAFLDAARVVATVGPGADDVSGPYATLSGVAMLLTIVFAALFTAGVVDRLSAPPFVAFLGSRTVPRSGHVIVVGLGQVGIRLCEELRAQGVPVVGVERDGLAPQLRLARGLGIPVVIGQGADRSVLQRLGLGRSRALAAVSSDDLDNVAVAVAVTAVAPETRVVLRAGEQEAIAETRSLMPLGVTRDVTAIAAAYVVARIRGMAPVGILASGERTYARLGITEYEPVELAGRQTCHHLATTRQTPYRNEKPSSAL